MKVLFAMDSMKGSLSSLDFGDAASDGLLRAVPDAEYDVRPIADGGEGTVEAITVGCDGYLTELEVTGPLGDIITARYGIIPGADGTDIPAGSTASVDGTPDKSGVKRYNTAVIDIASACGLSLIPESLRTPMDTTTYGVGELIGDAIRKGCRSFIIGLGGSSTNDCGIGMLQALGYHFYGTGRERLDGSGTHMIGRIKKHHLIGSDLEFVRGITMEDVPPELGECTFHIACDVTNPLLGEMGASYVYGPQKGAFDSDIRLMDSWMRSFVDVSRAALGQDIVPDFPGCGAAGGLGFCFKYFIGGEIRSGIQTVIEQTGLKKYIAEADLVVTGEGRLDAQTSMGKAPAGIAHIAKVFNKPVIMLAGVVDPDFYGTDIADVDAYFPVIPCSIEERLLMEPETARRNVTAAAYNIFKLYSLKA